MPVIATKNSSVVRVLVVETDSEFIHSEVSCLVKAADDGQLKIRYEHHTFQERGNGKGNWGEKIVSKITNLSGVQLAMLRFLVVKELAETFMGAANSDVWEPEDDEKTLI